MKRSTILPLLFLCACVRQDGGAPASHADESASDAPTDRLELSSQVRSNLGITFAAVEVRSVADTIRIPGSFELEPRARSEYRMALDGRVQLLVDQYDRVEEGALLYRYQSPTWPELLHEIVTGEQAMATARAAIAVQEAWIEEVTTELGLLRERLAALRGADVKRADLELDAARLEARQPRLAAELESARTALANAERTREHALHRAAIAADMTEAQLLEEVEVAGETVPRYSTIDWIEVRASSAGVVERLAATDRSFVESAQLVLSLVDPDRVRFHALALQADLPRLEEAESARIVPPGASGRDPNEGAEAELVITLEAHPMERTIGLFATPTAKASWIRPGVAAFLEVVVASEREDTLAIPRSSVVRDGLQHVFFRRNPAMPDEVIRVEADLGLSDGRWIAVHSGLMRGDQVVLDGVYELKLAMEQGGSTQQGGHFHADGSFHDDH